MEKVTGEQVRKSCLDHNISRVDHHECSLCGEMTAYTVSDGQLYFNSGCGCSWSPPSPRTWDSAAEYINRQERTGKWGDVRAKTAKEFGIELKPLD